MHNYRFIIIKPKFCLLYLNKNKYLMLRLKKLHYINKIYYIQNKMKKIWFISIIFISKKYYLFNVIIFDSPTIKNFPIFLLFNDWIKEEVDIDE